MGMLSSQVRGRLASEVGLAATLFIVIWAAAAEARTWRVEKGGSGDYSVIQDAIDIAANGDTIRIGPGQFTEYRIYVYSGNNWPVYANVLSGSLTIIGAGEGVTFIGADTPGTWSLGENAVGVLYSPAIAGSSLDVAAITFVDTNYGAYVQSGTFEFDQCSFLRVWRGVRFLASGTVRDCHFEAVTNCGVLGGYPAITLTIDGCSFSDCNVTFNLQLVSAAVVSNCDIRRCGSSGLFDQSAGSMRDCVVREMRTTGYGLEVYGPGSYTIADNSFDGGGFNVLFALGASNVLCERNVFSGSRDQAIHITSCTPRIRNNHILKNGGEAVLVRGFPQPPDLTIDVTGNYWGTASADSITAWIVDGNDPVVPPNPVVHGFVNFEPFSSVPVGEEKNTLGGVKALFR